MTDDVAKMANAAATMSQASGWLRKWITSALAILALIPASAPAQGLYTPGAPHLSLLRGVYGPVNATNGYSPSAIRINPTTYINSTSFGGSDTPYGIVSWWMKGTTGVTAEQNSLDSSYTQSYFQKDILLSANGGANTCYPGGTGACGSENTPGFDLAFDNQSGTVGTARINFNNSTGGAPGGGVDFLGPNSGEQANNGVWTHRLIAWDFTTATPKIAYYINGVSQSLTVYGGSPSYTAPLNVNVNANTNGFWIACDCTNSPGAESYDLAQLYIDTLHSPFSGSTVPTATVQAFYNSGPVNLGSTCNVLGYQPQVCLDGPASTFLTNKGASTATWSLAGQPGTTFNTQTAFIQNSALPPNAATPTVPTSKWASSTPNSVSGSSTALAAYSAGNAIAAGDTIILACLISENSTTAPTRAMQTPTGAAGYTWSALSGGALSASNGNSLNSAIWYAQAPAAVAPGTDIGVTVSYTAGGTPQYGQCNMYDYTHASAVSSTYFGAAGASYTWDSADINEGTSGPYRLMTIWNNFTANSQRSITLGPTAVNMTYVYTKPNGNPGADIETADQSLTGPYTTGQNVRRMVPNGMAPIGYSSTSIVLLP